MEIGSFIGLDLRNSGEYYQGEIDIARLNSARAGIFHACKLYDCNSIYLPYYLCPTVKEFLLKNHINVESYFINKDFEPINLKQKKGYAVLIVNYFGIISKKRISKIACNFKNVIIDNSAAFYSEPERHCLNVYSTRKFFGVPDGCYVIGTNAHKYTDEYKQDFSSNTSSFLLKRFEYELTSVYNERMANEKRIDNSGILNLSSLTKALLRSIDYSEISSKRQRNFQDAHEMFHDLNLMNPILLMNDDCVPLVYPLVIEEPDILERLKEDHIYIGRWWNRILYEVPDTSYEAWLSKYMIPIPIDQRYEYKSLSYINDCIFKYIKHNK